MWSASDRLSYDIAAALLPAPSSVTPAPHQFTALDLLPHLSQKPSERRCNVRGALDVFDVLRVRLNELHVAKKRLARVYRCRAAVKVSLKLNKLGGRFVF